LLLKPTIAMCLYWFNSPKASDALVINFAMI
jgi:hypothetical protein